MENVYVYNETKKCYDNEANCYPAIIGITNNIIELGYVTKDIYYDLFYINNRIYCGHYEDVKEYFFFNERIGYYILNTNASHFSNIHGYGSFPYLFSKNYEALYNFDIFQNRQIIKENKEYWATKYLNNFTFGLEFETSCGYIPQMECYRNGLIPLRDGSIRGLEYSTVVLKGNKGLNLLHQQLEQLKSHCLFDKDCSLHIHIGNFPVEEEHLFILYKIAKVFEKKIALYIPKWSYCTRCYKSSQKDYCKKLWNNLSSFDELYYTIVGNNYQGSLFDVHPDDPDRQRKWLVTSRYRWLNLVNMVCYDSPKTIEFRFLRPTFNETKIVFWLLLLTGILRYVMKIVNEKRNVEDEIKSFTLIRFINEMFDNNDAKQMKLFLKDLKEGIHAQNANSDFCGELTNLEKYDNLII